MPTPKKILIIRLSSMGDIVLTTPIIRALKTAFPNCQIDFLLKAKFESVLSANPYIDNLLLFSDMGSAKKMLKQNNYDYIIDLHNNLRSFQLKKATKAKSYAFPKANIEKWLMVNFKINYLPKKHIVDRYFEATKSLNLTNDQKGLDFFIDEQNHYAISENLLNENFMAIAIGAGHTTKQIPLSKLQYLIDSININVILLGDKNDFEKASKLKANKNFQLQNFCGQLNIQQTASVLNQANGIVCGDTGLMHIASALKTPIYSIWGNTIPAFGMYPYLPKNEDLFLIYEVENLPCRPCSKIGFKECPKQHFNCMNNIDYQKLVADINSFQ